MFISIESPGFIRINKHWFLNWSWHSITTHTHTFIKYLLSTNVLVCVYKAAGGGEVLKMRKRPVLYWIVIGCCYNNMGGPKWATVRGRGQWLIIKAFRSTVSPLLSCSSSPSLVSLVSEEAHRAAGGHEERELSEGGLFSIFLISLHSCLLLTVHDLSVD